MSSDGLSRRELIELGLLGGLAGLSGLGGRAALGGDARAAAGPVALPPATGRPRNIIFMISDGMSMGVPSLAEPFSQVTRGRGTAWWRLLQTPGAIHGVFETASLTSLVTDSAAASTALASGSRVINGSLNVLPDGRKLEPIGRLVRARGMKLGLVTTTTITHATPAGFAAIEPNREDQPQIAPQYLSLADVLLGGGRKFFDPALRADKSDLLSEYAGQGYALWDTRDQVIAGDRPPRVLGLFADGHLPYTIDQRADARLAQRVPTLAEMTRAALDILAGEAGFLLQVEGGRVDHAAHANDAAGMLWDQLAFDDAIAVVLEFQARQPDTLVVITSDHGNSNPGLNGVGDDYGKSTQCFERLARATASYDTFAAHCGERPTAERVATALETSFGVTVPADVATCVAEAACGRMPAEIHEQHRCLHGVLGQVLGNYTGIGWTGVQHTQDWVLLTAAGPGAERFGGALRNTDAYDRVCALLDITHRNPQMSAEAARAYASAAPVVTRPDWA